MTHPNNRAWRLAVLALAFTLAGLASWGASRSRAWNRPTLSPSSQATQPMSARASEAFGKLPLYFIENRGQVDSRVAYYAQSNDKTIYFTAEGLTFALREKSQQEHREAMATTQGAVHFASLNPEPAAETARRRYALKLDFVGANPNALPHGQDQTEAVFSYFNGSPDRRQAGLKTYARIVYPELWPGIDLVYAGTVNRMKYSFVVKPGADPNRIKLAYRGASEVSINQAGQLEVKTPVCGFNDERPVSYQGAGGKRVEVATAYRLEAGAGTGVRDYGFEVGEYDRSRELVIDPAILIYCGYIGGSGSDDGRGIAVDGGGNVYITGSTNSTEASFPVKEGPDLTFSGGDGDVFVAKVNAAGTALVYCGYIGGSGNDIGSGIAVDSAGNAYVTGRTGSTQANFPVTLGPDLSFNGNFDAFVAKVNAAGTALVYCGYIGGATSDVGLGIAIDSAGNAYVTGLTYSTQTSFPALVGPDLTYNAGGPNGPDAFVAKVNREGTALNYCGYIGGLGFDIGLGVAVDSAGNAYVTGYTESDQMSFPDGDGFGTVPGPDQTYNDFNYDAFVAKVKTDGTGLGYCGYIGGSGQDLGQDIAVDSAGNAYVTGATDSNERSFPVTGGPDTSFNGSGMDFLGDAFVAKVKVDGTGLVYCGYIGGGGDDPGIGIAVDIAGNAYVTGDTSSTNFPVTNGPDSTYNGGSRDAFVAKINADGAGLVYCGYIGGSGRDTGLRVAVDSVGNAYVTGRTDSTEATFPDGGGFGTLGGPDPTFNGGLDAFVAKIGAGVVTVSAASYSPMAISSKAIVAAFGLNVATETAAASSIPLPTSLAGTTVKVRDKEGTERLAPLYFVSQGQVNYQIPEGTAEGPAAVTITSSDGRVSSGVIQVAFAAPSFFTLNQSGSGPAAGLDAFTFTGAPFTATRANGEPNIIAVFGTGLGADATDVDGNVSASVSAAIDGAPATVLYAGRAPGFVGLNQFNIALTAGITSGAHTVIVSRNGVTSNTVTIAIK